MFEENAFYGKSEAGSILDQCSAFQQNTLRYRWISDIRLDSTAQRYGSQIQVFGNTARLFPVEDMDTVDDHRVALGMGPLHEYIERIEEVYGLTVEITGAEER